MINLEGITKKHVNDVCFEIIGACIEVHKILGPGLLESVYEACLLQEFKLREIKAKNQIHLPVDYKGITLTKGFRIDILVEGIIIVELKAVTQTTPIDEATLISYLNNYKSPKGLLVNFNVKNISQNIISRVSKYYETLPD